MGAQLGNNYGKFYGFQSKPVLLDLQFMVTPTNGAGVTLLKGQGVSAVYMHTSTTPVVGSPNPANGYAMIKLAYNYARVYCPDYSIVSPTTGSDLAINASALTVGVPYQITAVGAGTAGTATIQPVADTAGSLASKYFTIYDGYGNTFQLYFIVSGVGSAPVGVSGTLVPVAIATGATAAQVGTALVSSINNLPSGVSGVFSFTASGTTTVTIVSTKAQPIAGVPADGAGALATAFTFALTKFVTNLADWQAVGVPKGITPAVGVSFIATATGFSTGGASSGTVKTMGPSGVNTMEVIGDANLGLFPIPMSGSPNVGGIMIVQFIGPTAAGDTTPIPVAPAVGSIIKMKLLLEGGSRVGGNQE